MKVIACVCAVMHSKTAGPIFIHNWTGRSNPGRWSNNDFEIYNGNFRLLMVLIGYRRNN